jgi:hypothetical protein
VVLLGASLLTGAMCPRGILRATELSKLDGTELSEPAPAISGHEAVEIDLPPVPALRLREEQDVTLLSFSVAMAAMAAWTTEEPPAPPSTVVVDDVQAFGNTSRVPPRPGGDRAPPRSI